MLAVIIYKISYSFIYLSSHRLVFHFQNMTSATKFPSSVHEMIRPHSMGNYFSNRAKYIINRYITERLTLNSTA
jgi:hypothetical protein